MFRGKMNLTAPVIVTARVTLTFITTDIGSRKRVWYSKFLNYLLKLGEKASLLSF